MSKGTNRPRSVHVDAEAIRRLDPGERQLRFVHLNGQQPERTARIGGLMRSEFDLRCAKGPAWRRRVIGVLEEHAGPELLTRIEGVELRRGILRLEVAEPAVRSALGFHWQQRLLAIVQAHLPAAGITAVRFVMGSSSR